MGKEFEKSKQEPISFEKLLLLFRKTRKMMQESAKETRKMFEETDRKWQETDRKWREATLQFQETDRKWRETDRKWQETNKRFLELEKLHHKGDDDYEKAKKELERIERIQQRKFKQLESLFTGQWGKLIESLVEGKLVQILKEKGIDLKETCTRITSPEKDMELDIIAANGKDTVVVEVKTTLKPALVDEFLEKLGSFRNLFPRFSEENIFGAVAFLRDEASAAKYAQKKGLFIIKATGDSASVVNSENFKPKNW
ncbi:MAG: hypothetical protein GX121_05780 [Ignavibacteria bacterium]|nr:hypothetical protein [Ignavibacteria bacterium]